MRCPPRMGLYYLLDSGGDLYGGECIRDMLFLLLRMVGVICSRSNIF